MAWLLHNDNIHFFPEQARLTVLMADMSWHPVTTQAIPMPSLIFPSFLSSHKDIHKENLFLRLPLIVLVLPLTSRSLETLRQLQDQYPYIYYQLQTINLITCGSPPYQNTLSDYLQMLGFPHSSILSGSLPHLSS